MKLRPALFIPSLVGLLSPASCTSLPDIASGTCGNRVVDPGEDCDTFDNDVFPDGTCIAPGKTGQCRFACSDEKQCHGALGCGLDGVCRGATGELRKIASVPSLDASAYVRGAADFDGDGRDDLLVRSSTSISISFFEGGGAPAKSIRAAVGYGELSTGDFNGDGRSDLASLVLGVGSTTAIDVRRGGTNRVLAPTAYASTVVDAALGAARLVTVDAMPAAAGAENYGEEVLVLARDKAWRSTALDEKELFTVGFDTNEALAGLVSGGRLHGSLTCEQIVFGQIGDDQIRVTSPCRQDAGGGYAWNSDETGFLSLPSVRLPPAETLAPNGIFVVDIDGTPPLDVLAIHASTSMSVAYGSGDGSFHPDTSGALLGERETALWSPGYALNSMECKDTLGSAPPGTGGPLGGPDGSVLAVGHLDSDGIVDFVTTSGIYTSGMALAAGCPAVVTSALEAVISDLNGNGIVDVLLVEYSELGTTLAFYNGVPDELGTPSGRFNRFVIPVEGSPEDLAVGDFDGDLLRDVAVAVNVTVRDSTVTTMEANGAAPEPTPSGGPPSTDTLMILFGQPFGPPASPLEVGRMGDIQGLASGHLSLLGKDSIADLVVLSNLPGVDAPTQTLATFAGDTGRRLHSPFSIGEQYGAVSLTTVSASETEAGHRDLVFVGNDELVLLPVTGEAEISPSETVRIEASLPEELLGTSGYFATAELGGASGEEIVFLGSDGQKGVVVVGSVVDGAWVFPQSETTSDLFGFSYFGEGMEGGAKPAGGQGQSSFAEGSIIVADVDGDGQKDVVAVGTTAEQTANLVVMRGRGDGTLDVAGRQISALLDGFGATIAAMQLDTDAAEEIVLSSFDAANVYEIDRESGELTVDSERADALENGFALVSGDFDGDGVTDIATTEGTDIAIFSPSEVVK